ncbi:phospholipid/glycerol acyltransferase [Gloeothece citriformis PCC 7424]|uniref:Phospholipid/glycerol acyltransferase n=1 Tax=Gloeothece citriformis (strain PCC 7424) TaxID=65393 RepID=B7KAM6_GLOC7|nr:glycerol acyltransferase [Gloeothece citriformis]ACK68698.1 phospholipid/glycerol acyltransferase [Gloeothece citriformis PCC 7424]
MSHQLITRAQPPLEFIPPRFNPLVLQGCQLFLPLWLRTQTNLTDIQADGVEDLAQLYAQFQQGKIRFLMAFRHPSVNDPYAMAYLLWKLVPKVASQKGISLQSPIHAHFIYDRGIPLWAGAGVGWLASHLGGTSIQRGTADLLGLRSARSLFVDSFLPMAAAPEGATNGHNEIISPIEPGIAQLGFWCVNDLRKAQKNQEVFIVPIGIEYHYLTPPWGAIEKLLTELELESGIRVADNLKGKLDETSLYQRLFSLGEHLLSLMENFYRENYHQTIPTIPEPDLDPNQKLKNRLQNLLNIALQVAEEYFNLGSQGELTERCRRVEQAGWDAIYRDELKSNHSLSLVERGLADRVAEEASLRMWHMRIVENFAAVTGHYVKEKPTAERFAETILLVWDLVTRIQGENRYFRPQLGKQRVQIRVGKPMSISNRWDDYKSNRRQAVANLTRDLQTALEALILTKD